LAGWKARSDREPRGATASSFDGLTRLPGFAPRFSYSGLPGWPWPQRHLRSPAHAWVADRRPTTSDQQVLPRCYQTQPNPAEAVRRALCCPTIHRLLARKQTRHFDPSRLARAVVGGAAW
jgi:hypothetical protein